ncbi:MAG: CopD family protein [Nitrososphaerales archaeon]
MPIIDSLVTWIHLLSTSIWVGGSIFIGIVLAPMLKNLANTVEERVILMIRISRRFSVLAIPSLAVLVATGVYNANSWLASPDVILDSAYGTVLVVKIAVVASMIAAFGIHVKISSGRIEHELTTSHNPTSVQICKLRTRITWLGRIIVGQSVVILLLAAILDSI